MIRPYFSRSPLTLDRVAALLVTLAPLVYFFPAVRGRLIISPDDGVIFNVPLRVAAANLMCAGVLPLWNPYLFSGMPLHGAAQAGLLFPLNWFYIISSPPVATNLMMLTTYMLAALGAYLYARRAGANITGAVATSLIWQFSAFLVEQVGHTNVIHTAAMLPWVLWALEGFLANRSRGRGLVLATVVAVQVFAGHQQTCAYALLLSAVYAVVLIRAAKMSPRSYVSPLALLALGLLLAAVQILPTIELLRNSLRATASYDFFSSFSMPPRFALTLLAPYLFGGGNGLLFRAPYVGPTFFGEYVAYVGLLTIMLAFVAVLLKPDVRTKFWATAFIICLLLAFGRFLPFHLYAIVYYIPVLNLFRVPARHLMEVEFALAVLAGRGISVIAARRKRTPTLQRKTVTVLFVAVIVFLLTCLTVTRWRPSEFHLGRQAQATLLRAPELFLPILMAALSVGALWLFSRSNHRSASFWLLAVLLLDLALYGQGSGWRTNSPTRDSELWQEPATVRFLRDQPGAKEGSYRILTEDQPFNPAVPVPPRAAPSDWLLPLQPDIYMMHGIENAAGYDGFGLARYSRLVSDMKVWGELTEPERTLRGDSRELDLLNVRYLLTRPLASGVDNRLAVPSGPVPSATPRSGTTTSPADFPQAVQEFSGSKFAAEDLKLPHANAVTKLLFTNPPVEVDHLALVTNLSWAVDIPDGTTIAQIKLFTSSGKTFKFDLLAGEHTAEWAHDRTDIQSQIKHRRPPVATSYAVEDAKQSYQAHSYVAAFTIPERVAVTGGEIRVVPQSRARDLLLAVLRVSLIDAAGNKSFPLRQEWFTKLLAPGNAARSTHQPENSNESSGATKSSIAGADADDVTRTNPSGPGTERWRRLSQPGNVAIFENMRVMPRAWLATDVRVLNETETLDVIRSDHLPDGQKWDAIRVALIERPIEFTPSSVDSPGTAEVTRHEPNHVTVKTSSAVPAVLVLSENHYPGWRAYVDGKTVETLRVDYNLRGVTIPAGRHDVDFIYRPKSFLLGLAISLVTFVALLLWWRRLTPDNPIGYLRSLVPRSRRKNQPKI